MIHFITYSNDLYRGTRDYCGKMAKTKGKVDTVTLYDPNDIDMDFWEKNKEVLETKAGNGLWLWKPYFVYKKLKEVNEGDIVLYCDAGSFFFRSCKPIIDSMGNDDIWVSNIPLIEKQFTKPELLEMMDCTESEYIDTNQIQANFIAIRKTEQGIRFSKEWLEWCEKKDALTRETKYNKDLPDFKFLGHRSDQSVLSLLAKKWKLNVHLDPSQYGRVPEKYFAKDRVYRPTNNYGEYKCCVILHRRKTADFKTRLNQLLSVYLPIVIVKKMSKSCIELASFIKNEERNIL